MYPSASGILDLLAFKNNGVSMYYIHTKTHKQMHVSICSPSQS